MPMDANLLELHKNYKGEKGKKKKDEDEDLWSVTSNIKTYQLQRNEAANFLTGWKTHRASFFKKLTPYWFSTHQDSTLMIKRRDVGFRE